MIYFQYIGKVVVAMSILSVLDDIVRAIINQFKGKPYEWNTIKIIKEKREWWKTVLWLAFFALGVYSLIF